MFGKWHNGLYDLQYHPSRRGFDYFYGFLNGIQDYWNWNLDRNGIQIPSDGRHLTDVINEDVLDYLDENKSKPFFLFVSHHVPHTPLQAPDSLINKYHQKGDKKISEDVATIYAMIEQMDIGLGKIFDKLDNLGIRENTIIVFTSDNGAQNTGTMQRFQGPYSGNKSIVLEQGIRVPAIISWPGNIAENRIISPPVHGCDWLPTLAALSGISLVTEKPLDGIDLTPLLMDDEAQKFAERDLFFQKNRYHPVKFSDAAIIQGEWKLFWPGIPETMKKKIRISHLFFRGTTEPHWEMPCDTLIPLWESAVSFAPKLLTLLKIHLNCMIKQRSILRWYYI
jgi:arylsulfatase A-like enzyme